MELKEKLKKLRKEYELSLEKMGNKIGVSDTTIMKWEKGETEPKASNLKQIAKAFDISIDELLDNEK